MLHRSLSIAAVIAATASVSFAAAPTPPRAGNSAGAAQQQAPTRANMLKSLDSTYKAIDTNGDGTLSSPELSAAESKVQQQRIAAIRRRIDGEFTKLDTNKDGSLSRAEFVAAAPTSASTAPNGAAIATKLDTNRDGRITADEFRAPQVAVFDKIDTNHDGTISVTERQAAQAAAQRRN